MSCENKIEINNISCTASVKDTNISTQSEDCPNSENMLSSLVKYEKLSLLVTEEVLGLDSDDEDEGYCVITSDGVKFILTKEEMNFSKLLESADNDDSKKEDVPLPSVHSDIMSQILVFMKYHSKNPIPENNSPDKLISCSFKENIKCSWDVEFIENTIMKNPETAKENLYSLIRAANYMDIQPLLQLACTKVASMIKGKSLDAIKDIISTEKPYVREV